MKIEHIQNFKIPDCALPELADAKAKYSLVELALTYRLTLENCPPTPKSKISKVHPPLETFFEQTIERSSRKLRYRTIQDGMLNVQLLLKMTILTQIWAFLNSHSEMKETLLFKLTLELLFDLN